MNEFTKKYAERYGILPISAKCHRCGLMKKTAVPGLVRGHRALLSPPCPCGDPSAAPYAVVLEGEKL